MDIKKIDQELREKTGTAAIESYTKYRHRQEPAPAAPGASVLFLGTGGNPEAVFSQVPRTAGFILVVDGLRLYVDPGPGAVVRAREAGLDLGSLDGIFISHGHLDHYAGAEAVIEAMCWGMFVRRGVVLAPRQVLERDRLLSIYHQGKDRLSGYKGGPTVRILEAHQPMPIGKVALTPIPAYHGEENYGFILQTESLTLGYTSDTNYIQGYTTPEGSKDLSYRGPIMDLIDIVDYRTDIKEAFSQVDVLIANVTSHNVYAHRHITTLGLAHLLRGSKVKLCIMTHFNHCCLSPDDLRPPMATYVEQTSGVRTLYAVDGGNYNIAEILRR
ncbi:beta-lactamase domain protein [Desulforamulus reducens MI-1]|uniref:Beta-lactamase domain protein n=1 Tax=Desulforamulus reducens (strain ATCC BAA-1160 / DSM 100696 / MI-1) TaxID=349161 RepID=A4J8U3_DESRM|nr:MBL fold metallo-hydrolase [Desulforamulus reducens]ABO51496.1 beta-lactamase domain protein [Desulforamulus reducens MI-1]